MSFNYSQSRLFQRLKNSFTPVLAVVVTSGLICISIGSIKANQDRKQLQEDVAQSVYWQKLIDEIIHDREMLGLSAQTAVETGDVDWQGRYSAYEQDMMRAIAQLEDSDIFEMAKINSTVLKPVSMEREAFELIQESDFLQASEILSSESYRAAEEISAAQIQAQSDLLLQTIQSQTIRQENEWMLANRLIDIGVMLLTVSWCLLLARVGYYSLCRQAAQKETHWMRQKMAAHDQKIQGLKAALMTKHTDLESTLSELQETKDQLAASHQDVQVSRAALSQKAVTLEGMVDELQITEFRLAESHKDLQVSKAALSQKAATLETILEELQHAQMQMVQNEKMSSLGQLVAGIAHEINNPINFIYANLEPVKDYSIDLLDLIAEYQRCYPQPVPDVRNKVEATDLDFLKEDFPKVLASMAVGAERIQQIVLSLQNFSRSDEAGLKPANLHDGLESTLLILQHRLNERPGYSQIEVVSQYGDIPAVECYPGLINQVLMNLLSNAIDAIDELCEHRGDGMRGAITLRTTVLEKAGAQWVEIAIADTGIGIPRDIQGRIFDAFFTTKPVGKGTGMGLAISHTIVTKKHGGKLTFFSTIGEGSEFVVQLPVSVEAVPVEQPSFILQPPMASASVRGQAARFVL